jgi:acetylornithine deacetylase/succinyl-diaminopimelate desuccinylase-like protein
LRGLAYGEVVVEGPTWDLHSGSFGGAVPNPANALAKMLSNLHDKDGKVAVPDFYADVVDLNRKQRSAFSQLPFDEKWFLQTAGVSATAGEKGYTTLERIWGRPTLDINGIISGFVGDGAKTIIPRRATAKLSARLVANQKPEKILARIEDYLKGLAPPGVRVTFNTLYTGEPYLADVSGAPYVAARKALKEGFGADPVEIREGGSIPIVGTFSKVLRAPTVLMGFGLPDQNAHGPNENLRIENYQKGTRAISEFLFEMAKIT